MSRRTGEFRPGLFKKFSCLSKDINSRIVKSEIEGGVYLDSLDDGASLVVETKNRNYRLEFRDGGTFISGHPVFCPDPVSVSIRGSSWGGSMLKVDYIGRGMHLEFYHPSFQTIITSRIVEIRLAGGPLMQPARSVRQTD